MTEPANLFEQIYEEVKSEREALKREKFEELTAWWNGKLEAEVKIQNVETWFDGKLARAFRAALGENPGFTLSDDLHFQVPLPLTTNMRVYEALCTWVLPKLTKLMNARLSALGFFGFRVASCTTQNLPSDHIDGAQLRIIAHIEYYPKTRQREELAFRIRCNEPVFNPLGRVNDEL